MRRIATDEPPIFEARIAGSLVNRGTILRALGKSEEAVKSTQEAVAIYKKLALIQTKGMDTNLARALTNLSIHLSNVERNEEAHHAAEEAVEIYRRLSKSQPEIFYAKHVESLGNLCLRLCKLGRFAKAGRVSQDAIALIDESPFGTRVKDFDLSIFKTAQGLHESMQKLRIIQEQLDWLETQDV